MILLLSQVQIHESERGKICKPCVCVLFMCENASNSLLHPDEWMMDRGKEAKIE